MSEPQARMSLGEVILAIECIRDDIPTGYCSRGDIWNGLNDLLPKLRAAIGHEWPDKGAGTRTPAPGGAPLTFAELAAANASRCAIWHPGGLDEWSVADWAVAMAGEAGEVCNAVKKLRRVEGDTVGANGPTTREAAIEAIAQEIADTAIYLDLLAQRIGIRLEDCVVSKFNKVSEREGFPHRLRALLQEGTGG